MTGVTMIGSDCEVFVIHCIPPHRLDAVMERVAMLYQELNRGGLCTMLLLMQDAKQDAKHNLLDVPKCCLQITSFKMYTYFEFHHTK